MGCGHAGVRVGHFLALYRRGLLPAQLFDHGETPVRQAALEPAEGHGREHQGHASPNRRNVAGDDRFSVIKVGTAPVFDGRRAELAPDFHPFQC